jgi:Tol biopolymer transport system component
MGVWPQPSVLYATEPLDQLRLDTDLKVSERTTLIPSGTPAPIFIEASPDGEKLLFVETPLEPRPGFWGPLYEMDGNTSEKRLLRDSTHAVSSAVYLPGSGGEKVVYYSYGTIPEWNEDGPTPGYYLLDTSTGEDSLLLEHRSPAGLEEIVNGFDISPDGQTLLYPINHDNIRESRSPTVVRYDLSTATADTLDWTFREQFLWLRYSPGGQHLLFGNYPEQALGDIIAGRPEIGLIDLQTGTRRELDTRTTPEEDGSMDVFPRWSPSGRHVVYGSAEVTLPRGGIGTYSLYVLKNVN